MPNKTLMKYSLILTLLQCSLSLSAAPSDHFVTTWETTAVDTVITIPTFTGETYNYSIDWDNDMVVDETGITGDAVHDYGVAGVHTIRILGTFPRIYINNGVEKDKILSIDQWGTNPWVSMQRSFYGASNLIINANDTPNLNNTSDMTAMFASASLIGSSLDTGNWNWNTSNIINFSSMFGDAQSFNKNISTWNTTSVISFLGMFNGASSFNQDLSGWNVENALNSFEHFLDNTAFSTINYDKLLISWDAQNLFSGSSFIANTLQYCSQAAQDARASIIANYGWTFTDGGIDPSCDTSNPLNHFVITVDTTNAGATGANSFSIPTTGTGYNYSIDSNNNGSFNFTGVTGNMQINYVTGGIKTIRIAGDFPRIYFNQSGDKDKILSIEQWGTVRWTSMNNAFSGASNLVINATDTPDLSNVNSLFSMFLNASNIGNGTGNWNWDTSNIAGMANMFQNATSFDKDISSWNIENVGNVGAMFSGATLSDANYDALLISWDAQNVQPSLAFNGGNSKYCSQAAQDARASIIANDGWTINDGGLCAEALFRTTWKTNNPGTSNSTSITIPTEPTQTYAYQVDWNGDGDFDDADESTIQTGDATHDYGTIQSNQTVNILGLFPQIYFNNTGDKDKILSIEQWGTNAWTSMQFSFWGASNLIINANDTPDLSSVIDLSSMFYGASNLGNGTGIWNWDVSTIMLMQSMFGNASSFNKDISAWNTNNVSNMQNMFVNANSFNQDLSGWNVENVNTSFGFFLSNTAFSTTNYDKLLISWDAQNLFSGSSFIANTLQYCSQAAQDARASIIANYGWTFNDGGQSSSCTDELFANGFEDVIIVKSAQQHVNYDFSAINLDTLTQEPHLIVKGVDDYNKENMRIQIRNDLGTIQVRINFLINQKWLEGSWQELPEPKFTTLYWSIK